MHVIVAGVDAEDIGHAIEDQGHDVAVVDVANRPALEEAGILDTEVFVLTEIEQATSISVAKDLNPDLKVVVYARESLPDFARGQADLVVDPALIDAETVAEELDA
ncbi:MAG: CTP synthetase [Halapricum sp.]